MWGPLLYPYKIFIPIAAALLILQVIAEIIRDILAVKEGKKGMADNKRSRK
jgi:TRAP-type mannitol/chloroaromatic compound transport system permease small subunit